jgi:hypothetical protein
LAVLCSHRRPAPRRLGLCPVCHLSMTYSRHSSISVDADIAGTTPAGADRASTGADMRGAAAMVGAAVTVGMAGAVAMAMRAAIADAAVTSQFTADAVVPSTQAGAIEVEATEAAADTMGVAAIIARVIGSRPREPGQCGAHLANAKAFVCRSPHRGFHARQNEIAQQEKSED